MTSPSNSLPKRWCVYDHCHEFVPGSHNAVYCPDCKCKRKQENAVRSAAAPVLSDEELWALQENRKIGRFQAAQAKNEWLLNNSTFGFYDIETFDLAADFGLVMVLCIRERGGPTRTFVTRRPLHCAGCTCAHGEEKDEVETLIAARDYIESLNYIVSYYGTRFDLTYINTRLLINGERPIDKLRHVDLYYTVRNNLRLNRNRLANVELALLVSMEDALKGKVEKTAITPGVWRNALQGDQRCLDYIVDHCQKDVEILEQAFERLRGFVNLSATRWRKYGASY